MRRSSDEERNRPQPPQVMLRVSYFIVVALVAAPLIYSSIQSTSVQNDADHDDYNLDDEEPDIIREYGDSSNSFNEDIARTWNIGEWIQQYITDETANGIRLNGSGDDELMSVKRPQSKKPPIGRRATIASFMTLSCPDEPSKPGRLTNGIELYVHKTNRDRELAIFEDKQVIWRKQDVDSLVKKGFDVNKPTLIYLGGWLHRTNVPWLLTTRKNFDKWTTTNGGNEPFNLVIFDWGNYGYANYARSVSMVPHISNVLANFLEQLIDRHGYRAKQVHIIAYSLATHIAGLAGRQLQQGKRGSLAQITALDPTGVCFHSNSNKLFDDQFSLRPTDAKLVVARHYNMNQFGAGRLIGGVDIKINGGKLQPRMYVTKMNPKDILGALAVANGHHHRAIQQETVEFDLGSDCHEIAYECPSLNQFKRGQCADCGLQNRSCMMISTFGNIMLNQNLTRINYKLGTEMHLMTGVSQFCSYHYQVVAKLKPKPSQEVLDLLTKGQLEIRLDVELVAKPKYKLVNNEGILFTRLLRLDQKIQRFPERISMKSVQPELLRSIEFVAINFMSNISSKIRTKSSVRYCPELSGQLELVNCRRTLVRMLSYS